MKNYMVIVMRVERTELVYVTEIGGIPAESQEEARSKAEAILARLPGVEDERWSEGEPETTMGSPEILEVEEWEADPDALLRCLLSTS